MARLHRVTSLSPCPPLVHPLLTFTHPCLAVPLPGFAFGVERNDINGRLGEILVELFDRLLEGTILLDEVVDMRKLRRDHGFVRSGGRAGGG